jgi:hypothetical protein
VRIYGDGGASEVGRRMRELLREWHDAGRPFASGLRVEATVLEGAVREAPPTAGYVVDKRWHRYLFTPV